LQDVLNVENLHGLRKAVLFLIAFTLCIEGLGWFCLFQAWSHGDTVIPNLLWVSLFHTVSAFCNAGFSLFSEGLTHPAAIGNLSAQGTLLILIVTGGLGFPVLMEAGTRLAPPFRAAGPRRFSIHTRLVLLTTAALLITGTGLLYFSDPGTPGESPPQRLWRALFTAVTSRTAGFHISEMSALSGAATSVVLVLMFIGGSPGSFAGGVKTTTFALSLITVRHILLARREVQLFGRRITESLCNRAFAVLLLSLMWIVAATTVLLFLEPACPFLDLLFETVSAFATVGLSRGGTAGLSEASKLVLSLTMFVGRIGVLNFLFSLLIIPPRERRLSLPPERLIIE
jgi:trk system potassium uptake protein TrkH